MAIYDVRGMVRMASDRDMLAAFDIGAVGTMSTYDTTIDDGRQNENASFVTGPPERTGGLTSR